MDAEMYRALSASASASTRLTAAQKTRETQTTPRLLGNRNKPLPPVPRKAIFFCEKSLMVKWLEQASQ